MHILVPLLPPYALLIQFFCSSWVEYHMLFNPFPFNGVHYLLGVFYNVSLTYSGLSCSLLFFNYSTLTGFNITNYSVAFPLRVYIIICWECLKMYHSITLVSLSCTMLLFSYSTLHGFNISNYSVVFPSRV